MVSPGGPEFYTLAFTTNLQRSCFTVLPQHLHDLYMICISTFDLIPSKHLGFAGLPL